MGESISLRTSVRQHFFEPNNSLHTHRKNFSLDQKKVLSDERTNGISCKIDKGSVFISRMLISFRSRLEQGN